MLLVTIAFVLLAYLCWLLFTLAVNALPFYAAVTAGLVSYQFGSGPIAATTIGSFAAGATHVAGRLVSLLPWPSVRAAIAFLFAAPAGFAGYHAALGLAQVGAISAGWRHAVAIAGAVTVAAVAAARIGLTGLVAPPEDGQGAADVMSAGVRATATDRRAPRPRSDWRRSAR